MNHDMKYEKRKMCILKTIRRDFILSFAKLSWHPKYILNIFLVYDIEYNAWIWTSLDRHIRSGIFEKDFDNTCFVQVLYMFCTCFVHVLYMFCHVLTYWICNKKKNCKSKYIPKHLNFKMETFSKCAESKTKERKVLT